ncbi:MAG: glutathione S-transferase N-terminal domain-containing protein [Nitratireductor sp.]
MYKLIGSPTTRAFRVPWMLEELGVAYELERVGPRSEAILAVNPAGKVPALLADGEAIIDSVAIIQFLADRHGRFTFLPVASSAPSRTASRNLPAMTWMVPAGTMQSTVSSCRKR